MKQKVEWRVNIKGERNNSPEISIVRSDFEHGFKSYGWFGDNKILIYDTHSIHEYNTPEYLWDAFIKTANEYCKELNKKDIYIEVKEKIETVEDKILNLFEQELLSKSEYDTYLFFEDSFFNQNRQKYNVDAVFEINTKLYEDYLNYVNSLFKNKKADNISTICTLFGTFKIIPSDDVKGVKLKV